MCSIHFSSGSKDLVAKSREVAVFYILIQTSPPRSWRNFGRGKWVGGIKSPKHAQSPEMIRQSHRIPGLFHVTEASSVLFCPEHAGQSKQKSRHVFAAFPDMFAKTTECQGFCRGNLCNVQMPAHEMILRFPSAPSVAVGILTPNPSLHT